MKGQGGKGTSGGLRVSCTTCVSEGCFLLLVLLQVLISVVKFLDYGGRVGVICGQSLSLRSFKKSQSYLCCHELSTSVDFSLQKKDRVGERRKNNKRIL